MGSIPISPNDVEAADHLVVRCAYGMSPIHATIFEDMSQQQNYLTAAFECTDQMLIICDVLRLFPSSLVVF